MPSVGDDPTFRLCSIHALSCLSKDELIESSQTLQRKRNAHIDEALDLSTDPEHVVPPDEVGSAGRVSIEGLGGRTLNASLIFSRSVPFDAMANIEIGHTCARIDCLDRCLEYILLARSELSELLPRYDVECVTVVTDRTSLAAFRDSPEAETFTELYSGDWLAVYSVPYPHDCLIIIGQSEGIVTEVQTAIQNIFRIRGGAHHLNKELAAHVRGSILPLRERIAKYALSSSEMTPKQKLGILRPLRNDFFEVQTRHSELMAEFESMLEYETLYLQASPLAIPKIPALISEMRDDFLEPLKLLRSRANSSFQDASAHLESAVNAVYADISIDLGEVMRMLTIVQAIVACVLVPLTIVQVVSIFVK